MTKIKIPETEKINIVKDVKQGKISLYLTSWNRFDGQFLNVIQKNKVIKKYKVRFPNPKIIEPSFNVNEGYAFKSRRFITISDTIKNIFY